MYLVIGALLVLLVWPATADDVRTERFPLPEGSHPHDVAPVPEGPDGKVWYTSQYNGVLGRLDPATGEIQQIRLGEGSRPHGVIVGPDGLAWVTDGGLNAIVSVHPKTLKVRHYPLPEGTGDANLNTATFDADGMLWFTGQNGIYGALDPGSGKMRIYQAPGGFGPYGIHRTPNGEIWYASLAGNYIGRIDTETGKAQIVVPPTDDAGPRRIWSDSKGQLWVSEWNVGQLACYTPGSGADTGKWREWPLPGDYPTAYSVYVDENDKVWLSDFGANAVLRFDPENETFQFFPLSCPRADVRQMMGRNGEVWAAESGCDHLAVYRYD